MPIVRGGARGSRGGMDMSSGGFRGSRGGGRGRDGPPPFDVGNNDFGGEDHHGDSNMQQNDY